MTCEEAADSAERGVGGGHDIEASAAVNVLIEVGGSEDAVAEVDDLGVFGDGAVSLGFDGGDDAVFDDEDGVFDGFEWGEELAGFENFFHANLICSVERKCKSPGLKASSEASYSGAKAPGFHRAGSLSFRRPIYDITA